MVEDELCSTFWKHLEGFNCSETPPVSPDNFLDNFLGGYHEELVWYIRKCYIARSLYSFGVFC